MKLKFLTIPFLLLYSCSSANGADLSSDAIELNNKGVSALNALYSRLQKSGSKSQEVSNEDWETAFKYFRSALHIAPDNEVMRKNLVIAHCNYALILHKRHDHEGCVKQYHQAKYLDPSNSTLEAYLDCALRKLGTDPNSFEDRVLLGDLARKDNDLVGALVEYKAAYKIRQSKRIQNKIEHLNKALLGARQN